MPGFTIEGISSGINTGDYIDAIIAFERRPAVLLEADQAEKTNIVSTLSALQAKILALKSKTLQLTRKATFEKGTVAVSDETVLTAKATGRVAEGSYNVQVLSLARNHQLATQGFSSESAADFGTGSITISVGGASAKTITIDSGNNSLVGIKQAINDANAGVRATIINDGSESKPYRLIITADQSGFANTIEINSGLSGGSNLNLTTSSFDDPEEVLIDSSSDAVLSLGASAAFTGDENKTYTFTVQGTGTQVVGTDNITVDWSDGTNSGSIVFTQADTEVELVGAGSDGLKLSLSAGQLTAGDVFQVQTFSPLLQAASDAKLAVGSSGGTGSPITVTSRTNTFANVIAGVTLDLSRETTPGEFVTINTDLDVTGIKNTINDFISAYNDVNGFIDDQNSYNEDTQEVGILLGDSLVQSMQYSIRRVIGSRVTGLTSNYNQLATIGIRTGVDGKLSIKDSTQFENAIRDNLDNVINMFANSGSSSTNLIDFMSAGSNTEIGNDYAVNITQAATQGTFTGTALVDPATTPITLNSSNNRLKFTINNVESDQIILAEKTYNSTAELIKEIQDKIDGDARIGNRGLTVAWVSTGAGIGNLELTSSTYGSGSKVGIVTSIPSSALAVLGLVGGVGTDGKDVEGTINGEEAEGSGQYLTGKDGNATTDGLKLRITFTQDQLGDGDEGTISITKGVASSLDGLLDSLTKTGDGLIDRRISSYESQIENIRRRVQEFDERLLDRRERLQLRFQRMEELLGQLSATSQYLAGQLTQIQANWNAFNSRVSRG
ncbi:MAG: flagellar filament capping protein FliD [Candidatus Zixiibacteriota bacterium]|nr:MAG: flagellar filament capping protein FliD [candidate division Zixibacteria bacterium]